MRYLSLIARLILAGVFLYAGLVKASSSAQFANALIPFTFLGDQWLGPISRTLPWVEIGAAILILLPWTRRLGAAVLLVLCLLFIAVLGWALANGIIVSCACFGQDETPSAAKMAMSLSRDVALMAMAVIVLVWPRRR